MLSFCQLKKNVLHKQSVICNLQSVSKSALGAFKPRIYLISGVTGVLQSRKMTLYLKGKLWLITTCNNKAWLMKPTYNLITDKPQWHHFTLYANEQ